MSVEGMDLAVQAAVDTLLRADSPLVAFLGNDPAEARIYQEVPANPVFPYVTLGETNEIDDSVQCLDASELFFDIHVWTREKGYNTCKKIATAIKRVIHNADLNLGAENKCLLVEHHVTRVFSDQDEQTKHGVITFRALTEIIPA